MSILYVNEDYALITVDSNYIKVQKNESSCRKIPIETLESINIFGKAQMSTQCIEECLKRGIYVAYYSKYGSYYGRLQPIENIMVERQRQQARLYNTKFAIDLAKIILHAKIKNQEVLLRRYARNKQIDISREILMLDVSADKLFKSEKLQEIIGHEGNAAKYYFKGLSNLVEPEFAFNGRSRRTPKDEFNAMISLGYSILMNEMYSKIENKGLNPYFGFIHRDKENHPTLVSDLIEEWRAIIVDSVVMSLINGHEIGLEHFYSNMDEPGCFLTKEGMKIFITKLEKKERTDTKYLSYIDYAVSFRRAIELQIGQLVKALEIGKATLYKPIRIR